jgi:pimeloyl-ACP methyl ester carboxylesterase
VAVADGADMTDHAARPGPLVPQGHQLRIRRRGTSFVRDVAGPPGAPTVILLHGLGATAAVNWPGAFQALSGRFRVVALDHRGHGRGIRTTWPFRLEDCADDAVGLAETLGIDRFIAVGYSMGGPVALLVARRHPGRVAGMVLCATAARFGDEGNASPWDAALATTLRVTPPVVRRYVTRSWVASLFRDGRLPPGLAEEVRHHDPAAIVEATRAIRAFDARSWAGKLGVPATSVVTGRDRFVPPWRQLELAEVTGASIRRLDADHDVAFRHPARFLPVLLAACEAVARQTSARV